MTHTKAGRNDMCPCGSGRKFKRCCAIKTTESRTSKVLLIAVGGAILAALVAGMASFTTEPSAGMVWDAAHGHYHDATGSHP